ncbi:MAG: DUF1569 domain-containing protein [Chitinophagaceae bacterium]|nr:DUF1569 domain-containing protein [Chitinophagaceae bacterium]
MKSIFDVSDNDELLRRINTLNEKSTAQWGKMTIYQMLKHCTLWEEMITGEKKFKRMLLGMIFGRMALNRMLRDDRPMPQNAPTVPGFAVRDDGDIQTEKAKWINYAKRHLDFSNDSFVHPFFGRMSKGELGQLAYKHTDHHLRQFNC